MEATYKKYTTNYYIHDNYYYLYLKLFIAQCINNKRMRRIERMIELDRKKNPPVGGISVNE